MLYPHVLSSGRLVFYPHRMVLRLKQRGSGVFSCVQPVHQRVVVGVTWQTVTKDKTHTVKHLSHGLPAATISNSNQTCVLTSGPIRVQLYSQRAHQRRTPWSVFVLCCIWLCVYTYSTHSLSYFCLYFVIYPWVSDCITPLKRIKAATHTHTLTKTHSSTHTNSSPCHCITTHAQALVNPSPFIMHHEHTPLQAQKRRSRSAWHCFFKVVQVKGVGCKRKCNKINIEVA